MGRCLRWGRRIERRTSNVGCLLEGGGREPRIDTNFHEGLGGLAGEVFEPRTTRNLLGAERILENLCQSALSSLEGFGSGHSDERPSSAVRLWRRAIYL